MNPVDLNLSEEVARRWNYHSRLLNWARLLAVVIFALITSNLDFPTCIALWCIWEVIRMVDYRRGYRMGAVFGYHYSKQERSK